MKTVLFAAAVAAAALGTSAAHAGDFGPPSAPTIWGHAVEPSQNRSAISEVGLETERNAHAGEQKRFGPSAPTIWGHAVEGGARAD